MPARCWSGSTRQTVTSPCARPAVPWPRPCARYVSRHSPRPAPMPHSARVAQDLKRAQDDLKRRIRCSPRRPWHRKKCSTRAMRWTARSRRSNPHSARPTPRVPSSTAATWRRIPPWNRRVPVSARPGSPHSATPSLRRPTAMSRYAASRSATGVQPGQQLMTVVAAARPLGGCQLQGKASCAMCASASPRRSKPTSTAVAPSTTAR